jgi:hypothetical protein
VRAGSAKEAECAAGSDGILLPKESNYTFRLFARSEPPGMRLDITTGGWRLDPTALSAFHTFGTYTRNETVPTTGGNSSLSGAWQQVTGELPAKGWDRYVQIQLSGGPGRVYIDNTFIGADLNQEERRRLLLQQ